MNIKGWLVLVSIIVFVFAISQATNAAVLTTAIVNFDQKTLERGYTVKSVDHQLWLPIFPNQFENNLTIKISQVSNADLLPEKMKAVTNFYAYDVRTEKTGVLERPVLLSLAFQSDNLLDKSVYFYDTNQKQWRALESTVDSKNKLVRARTIFPNAKVVVLENDPTALISPISGEFNQIRLKSDVLTAQSAIVIDKNSGNVVFAKNVDQIRPIASLTKLVAALVFLDNNPGWESAVTMQKSDFVGGAALWVKEGDQVSVKDLFYSALTGSKNNAVKALVRSTGLTDAQFIGLMNAKVRSWGLNKTRFVEPTGLNENNVSTAEEMAVIARKAFNNMDILKATTIKWYKVRPLNRDATYWVKNTSKKILDRDLYITGSKTGWTDEAGYNLVTQAKERGKELIALVMGASISQNYEEVYGLLKKYL